MKANRQKPAHGPAPSRHVNKQAQKVLDTIAGYQSVVTLSAALQAALAAWVLPAIGFLAVVLLGSSFDTAYTFELLSGLSYAVYMMSIVSLALVAYWFMRSYDNVARLGVKAQFGMWGVFVKALKSALPMIVLAIAAMGWEKLAPLWPMIFFGLVMGLTRGIKLLFQAGAKFLWMTSVSPEHPENEVPRLVDVATFGWWFAVSGFINLSRYRSNLSLQTLNWSGGVLLTTLVMAVGMAAAAVAGGMAVNQLAARQEARLQALRDAIDTRRSDAAPVSSEDIKQAWTESESLIGFDYGAKGH